MYIEFLIEEPSTEAALYNLIPRIIGDAVDFAVHPYQGKLDLLTKLPQRDTAPGCRKMDALLSWLIVMTTIAGH